MLALGIDTSTPEVSVALADDDRLLTRQDQLANNAHGEVLASLIDAVLRDAGISATQLHVLGVGLGPGPFTGLRVGIVTAAALSDALGIPAYGRCSLDVVVPEHAQAGNSYAVVTDARRRQVYWAVYDDSGARVDGPDIAPPADLAERIRGRVRAVIGPGALQYADAFGNFVVESAPGPDAYRLAVHAAHELGSGVESRPLLPMYLRRPDAREPGPPKRVTPT